MTLLRAKMECRVGSSVGIVCRNRKAFGTEPETKECVGIETMLGCGLQKCCRMWGKEFSSLLSVILAVFVILLYFYRQPDTSEVAKKQRL